MALSNDLISQFVKITNDEPKDKKETIVYGTIQKDTRYVKIDGSDILTPIATTTVVGEGDRVTVMIKNHAAIVTGNLSSPAARSVDTLDVEKLNAQKARIDVLETANLTVQETLKAHNADIDNLYAKSADIDELEAGIADINTLIFGSATGDIIQTSFANSVIAQLGDAQIKSAMIESISASKITAGDIITNNVRVMSEDGKLVISDETLQISDSSRVRVQIGKDESDDYSINIWDQNGNLMFSKGGITDAAIKEAIIRNDMVSDTANIHASKLDIDSLFEEINGSSNTIKSTKVYLDEEKQTLDVAFKSLTTEVTEQGEVISSQGTAISTIQGQISSKVWQQDIDTATDEMSTKYSTLEQEVDSFKTTVNDTTTNLGTRMTTVEQTAADLTVELENLEIGGRNLVIRSRETAGRYIGTDGADVAAVACSLSEYIAIKPSTDYMFTKTTGTKDNYFRYAWYASDKTYIGRVANSNNEFLWKSPSSAYYIRISYPTECKVKFEKGNRATDWSPAPEDINSDILDASKSATDYLNFSNSGLVIGDHTGSSLDKNVLIDSNAVKIRTGTIVHSVFGPDIIELAKDNESATISMLNGAFKIYYDADNSDGGFGIYGKTSGGTERLAFQAVNENDNLTIGWGGYAAGANLTNIYGNGIHLYAKDGIKIQPGAGKTLEIAGRAYGANQILWSGARYMTADHTATLSANVSDQPHGIVLVFSQYTDGAAVDQSFHEFFVPKYSVTTHSGKGHVIHLSTSNLDIYATKYLYISDDKITGHANNGLNGTADSGITYSNSSFVLRYVVGV